MSEVNILCKVDLFASLCKNMGRQLLSWVSYTQLFCTTSGNLNRSDEFTFLYFFVCIVFSF